MKWRRGLADPDQTARAIEALMRTNDAQNRNLESIDKFLRVLEARIARLENRVREE